MEEADLVVQAKLIRSKDQRVTRLQDLTMRPTLAGKTVGALEAHTNGLRFSSQKNSVSMSRWVLRNHGRHVRYKGYRFWINTLIYFQLLLGWAGDSSKIEKN